LDGEIPKKNSKKSKVVVNGDVDVHQNAGVDVGMKKSRIVIKLSRGGNGNGEKAEASESSKEKKKPSKRKRDASMQGDNNDIDEEVDVETIPRKRKKDPNQVSKYKKEVEGKSDGRIDDEKPTNNGPDDIPIFLNLKFWKQCRESLDGTFKSARKNLTQLDSWVLPLGVPDDKFADIANNTLDKMTKYVRSVLFFCHIVFLFLTQFF
jgi:hypothetical protein